MTQGELIYFMGVVVAFLAFGVTLAALSHGQRLPPIPRADEEPARPSASPSEPAHRGDA